MVILVEKYIGTKDPQLAEAKIGGTEVLLVDTPGFDDTERSDGDILLSIARMITAQHQLGIKLKGVIYIHNIQIRRMGQSSIRQLELFRRICGDETLGNVLFVTTGWHSGPGSNGFSQNERQLRNEFWAPMIQKGAKAFRFFSTQESAASIVSQLLGKEEVTLALQREMIGGNLKPNETSAGLFAAEARASMEKEYKNMVAGEEGSGGTPSTGVDGLEKSLERSRNDRKKLGTDVVKEVNTNIIGKVEETKKHGRITSVIDLIGWLISLAGFGGLATPTEGGGIALSEV